jgi:hypothetical protein
LLAGELAVSGEAAGEQALFAKVEIAGFQIYSVYDIQAKLIVYPPRGAVQKERGQPLYNLKKA